MTLPLNVELQLDRRSAASVASDAERELATAGRNISQSWRTSMSGASAAIREGLGGAVTGVTSNFGEAGRAADATFGGMVRSAGGAGLAIGGIGLAAVAVGKQVYDLGAQWDNVVDSMAGRTGKIGDELTALKDAVRDVASVTASPIAAIGDIAAQVSQATRLTGADLENMTAQIANFNRISGQDIDVRGMGKTFRLFDVNDVTSQVDALNALANASWATGVPINELMGTVGRAGKAAQEFGLDIGQTAGLLVEFEQAGLDIGRVESSLSIALKNFAKDGREPAEALRETITEIKNLSDAGQDAAAASLAQQTFGRGYIDFLNAIKGGNLDVDALNKSLSENGNTIQQVTDATADFSEEWTKFTNNLSAIAEPAATSFFNVVNAGLTEMINNTRTMFELKPSDGWDYWGPTLFGAAWQGDTGGDQPGSGSPNSTQGGNRTSRPTSRGGSTMPSGGWYGGDDPGTTGSGSSSSSKPGSPYNWDGSLKFPDVPDSAKPDRPPKPVVPYSGDPTSLIQGFPQTSALYGAAESVLNARHDHAQAEAELNALEADNQATAEEIQTARNKLAQADSNTYQTELRLNEAKASSLEKYTKQMDSATGQLGEIGAKLDQDLGVSKGLAGIADNLERFVGNLIAAPELAKLNALSNAPGQAQGGYGLLGIAGAQGAFGPQYTAAGQAAASGQATATTGAPATFQPGATPASYTSSSPYTGGYPGDAALLANVPAGSYSQTQAADLTKGIGDCSSAVEDLVNIMDGRPTGGRSMATGNADEWLTAHGFQQGSMPGAFNVGFNSGHMQATLPGGTPFNWGSDASAGRRGVGGSGAFDPAFTDHYYRPVSGGGKSRGGFPESPAAPNIDVQVGPPGGGESQAPGMIGPFGVPPSVAATQGGLGTSAPTPLMGGGGPASSGWAPQQGGPQFAPFGGGGPGQSPTQLGAAVEPTSNPQGGGFGITQGGPIDTAMGLAAMAFPGAGQAAQTAMKLANRAIQYGGQVAGIATQGALDTFLPWGGSELASKNWLTRLVGAAAGASPALPNMAGKAAAPLPVDPNTTQHGQGAGQPPGPINQGVQIMGDYHQNGTEDQASSALASHLTAQNTRPGP